jgi:hypothetical protein
LRVETKRENIVEQFSWDFGWHQVFFSEFVYDQNEKEECKINLSSTFTLFSFFTKSETKQISSKTISCRSDDISSFNIFWKLKQT